MSAFANPDAAASSQRSSSAWDVFQKQPMALWALGIVALYGLIALLGFVGALPDFQTRVAEPYMPPQAGFSMWLGSDIFGRSVVYKLLVGTQTAMTVGFLTTAITLPLGVGLGALAGYFGGKVDVGIVWLYSVIASVPYILLIVAISWALGKGMASICIAMGCVGWVGLCRLVRGETLKHKNREYVLAARLIGAGEMRILGLHILPNVLHVAIISASLQVLSAIKAEVILTYLGVGIQNDASWGSMIAASAGELSTGVWWPLAGVVGFMFAIMYALNVLGDALRDALDPRMRR